MQFISVLCQFPLRTGTGKLPIHQAYSGYAGEAIMQSGVSDETVPGPLASARHSQHTRHLVRVKTIV